MKILKTKTFFTYLVVGALVMALYVSCKSNEEPSSPYPELSQYAGIYVSDNNNFGSSKNQYFVIRINSDNTVDYGVSDSRSFSTVSGTFPAYFFIDSDSSYNLKLTVDGMIGDASLVFSNNVNTITYGEYIPIDGIYDWANGGYRYGNTFTMTKVN